MILNIRQAISEHRKQQIYLRSGLSFLKWCNDELILCGGFDFKKRMY